MPRPSNREHLLDCAEELYAAQGVGAVSLRTIQAAAGLSVGSLRYHFKTEADLNAFITAHNTKVSDVVEISRKVLASP